MPSERDLIALIANKAAYSTDRMEEVSRAPGMAQERPTDRMEEVSRAPGKAQERPTDRTEEVSRAPGKARERPIYPVEGIGDDCAIIPAGEDRVLLVTVDTLVEKVHFDLAWHPPGLLGRKAAAVNLSDIAAMGGMPRYGLLSLALTDRTFSLAPLLVDGLLASFQEHGVLLIGGDTVRSGHEMVITVTLIGEGEKTTILRRRGARPGDAIFVSGRLGQSAAGLDLCRREDQRNLVQWQELVAAHLNPRPQVALGRLLAASGLVTAMMDLSDGIATDLAHLCAASDVGAVLDRDCLPLSPALIAAAEILGTDPVDWALTGGEDYQLLFTMPLPELPRLQMLLAAQGGAEIFPVGRIVAGKGVRLNAGEEETEISFRGFDHFG